MTYQDTVCHALSDQARSLELQRDRLQRDLDVTTTELVSALAETYVLRDAIERALKVGLHPTVENLLRKALQPIPLQRVET